MNKTSGLAQRIVAALCLAVMLGLSLSSFAAEALTGTVNADKVFFRMKANTDSEYYAKLSKGAKVALLGTSGDFYKVRYDSKVGYVMKKFVTVSDATAKKLKEATQPKSTSKYADAKSISALGTPPKFCKLGDKGEHVEKLQRALQLKKFYEGTVDGGFGKLTQAAVMSFQKKYGLKQTGEADYDTVLKLFGSVAETTAKTDPQMKGISSISDIAVPKTTSPGNTGRHVKALQQALKLKGYYKAAIDSSYGDKTAEAVKAFQKASRLTVDGVAGYATIKKLFGQNAANYTLETERLDWFKNGSATIPKGATFTVKDIATGKTFSATRWSGVNHLDAEPTTSDDTDTVKAVFGGEWSWRRRAILVKYNGHVYAASMNGMPHGTTTIDNEFSGHFCIHFYNSRTHDTNRVDETHQNAVASAMKATW